MEIESREVQTIEDEISGEFCECGHEISEEHFVGSITGITKCYAMIFNGTAWNSCNCPKLKEIQFSINILVPDYANNSQNISSN